MSREFIGVALLIVAAASAYGEDWREVYKSDFAKAGWDAAWNFKGSAGPKDQGGWSVGAVN